MHSGLLSLHLIAVICWFAGLFYLPRLFVYHSMTQEKAVFEQFKVMEYKLYYYIMHPSLLLTLGTGIALIFGYCQGHANELPALNPSSLSFWAFWVKNWLVWKVALVFLLLVFHVMCGVYLKRFKSVKTPQAFKVSSFYKSDRFFRFFNEVPTVILIVVVCLAVFKP